MSSTFVRSAQASRLRPALAVSLLLAAGPAVAGQAGVARPDAASRGGRLEYPRAAAPGRAALVPENVSPSAARRWNEALLEAIRGDFPKPPVHARNLFHLSVAMWDAWAAYDPLALGYLYQRKHAAPDREAARSEAISFAAYRLLEYRFPVGYLDAEGRPCHPNAAAAQAAFDVLMDTLGYDGSNASTDGDSPAAIGNRIAGLVIAHSQDDGANEGAGRCYPDDTAYTSVNPPLILQLAGVGELFDPNRWQPLAFDHSVTQNGIPIGASIQKFIGVGWGDVPPFALRPSDRDPVSGLYLDPGPPPQLGGAGDDVVKAAIFQNILFGSQTDPRRSDLIDISPAVHGNNRLGSDRGRGHVANPVTGRPYPPNFVNRADYVRVVAEFWADGPRSETPPGHWNAIANYVSEHPALRGNKRIGGTGRKVGELEWDVKMYFALNGALHDAAIACWAAKHYYDSSRPITLIRYMGGLGQSSDPSAPSYHPDGLPLVRGLIEVIVPATTRPRRRHSHLKGHEGEIAVRAWRGSPPNRETQLGGVGWKLATLWMPYQLETFVTPPFPGYSSGHSTYSRAAAEVLTALTGSRFFPGGLGEFVAPRNEHLEFERGPSQTVTLQWATYYDAADEAAISRRFGGIHPSFDDYPARRMGSIIGPKAWARALELFSPGHATLCHRSSGLHGKARTIRIGTEAVAAHLAHGDTAGSCPRW